jgi:LysM repeat protein
MNPKPTVVKKGAASVKHLSAPLKGLSLSSKLIAGDPLTAPLLDNWVVEENRIKCRAGTKLQWTYSDTTKAVVTLIPHYGVPNKFVSAIDHKLVFTDSSVLKAGFTSDDWHWTSFSNLAADEYTVMVNGTDGVWSWNGANTSTVTATVAVTKLTKTNPATITVASGDISKFANGMEVVVAGAVGTGMTNANGAHFITSVGTPANTFTLVGVDCSTGAADLTTGITVDPPDTGVIKENITAPAGATYIVPNSFQIVLSHMNRLWFADSSNLSVYYLPLQQKSGTLKELPLNAVFKRGGSIRALGTWTVDGGTGMDDMLAIFSTNGEVVIYSGVDPDADMSLVGVFRFDSPMSRNALVNYGGDLYVLISTGLVPMSTLVKSETEQLGQSDRNIFSQFFSTTLKYRSSPGWQVIHNPSSGRLICNMPLGSPNSYQQVIRFMPNPVWATWSKLPSRCWLWINARMFFGSDDGKVYEIHPSYLNDNGNPIRVDLQMAWSNYGSVAIKQFKMVLPYIISDGTPRPFVDFRVDYDTSPPVNQPDTTSNPDIGATWDLAAWNTDAWAGNTLLWNNWQGVAAIGRVGGPRLMADVLNCEFSVAGFDIIFENGSVFG